MKTGTDNGSGSAHTPGPWEIHRFNSEKKDAFMILPNLQDMNGGCAITSGHGPDQTGNARLISASPDLLAALKHPA